MQLILHINKKNRILCCFLVFFVYNYYIELLRNLSNISKKKSHSLFSSLKSKINNYKNY